MFSPRLVLALVSVLLLAACGYGWKEEPRIYPPSSANSARGQVVSGNGAAGGDYVVQPGDTLYALSLIHISEPTRPY